MSTNMEVFYDLPFAVKFPQLTWSRLGKGHLYDENKPTVTVIKILWLAESEKITYKERFIKIMFSDKLMVTDFWMTLQVLIILFYICALSLKYLHNSFLWRNILFLFFLFWYLWLKHPNLWAL